MICPLCQTDNPARTQRCRACGAPLQARTGESSAAPDALPKGTLLAGTYAVEAVLGQGGFGITYACHDQMLDRRVAVKEFFPSGCRRQNIEVQASRGLSDASFREARAQFLAEARTLARCHHVGIVGVHAAFEANSTAYMVMELLSGKTLAQLLSARGGALNEAEAVGIIERVGEALQFVHEQNLLHRDIKPDNIIVCDDGRVMLIDFGTARETIQGAVQGHTVVVTPGYAPLEQYAKQAKRGPFTDIYSLAATLYQLLTGTMPPAASDRAMGVQLRSVRESKPQIGASVAFATECALRMEIAKRPQSVRDFLDLLRAPVENADFEAFFQPQPAPSPLDEEDLDEEDLAAWPAALSPDALRARQALWQAGVAPVDTQSLQPQPAPAPPDDEGDDDEYLNNNEVPATLSPDALRARQSLWQAGVAPVDPQPVKLAPPRAFPLGAHPPKATSKAANPPLSSLITSGGASGVNVKNASDINDSAKALMWVVAILAVVFGFVALIRPRGAPTPATSSGQRISSDPNASFPAPMIDSANNSQRVTALQKWDALRKLDPISVVDLPISKNESAPSTAFAAIGGGIEFSLDANRLAYVDSQAVLRVLNMPDRRVLRTLKLDKKYPPLDVMFAPDNETIAVLEKANAKKQGEGLRTEIWNLKSGKRTSVLEGKAATDYYPLAITAAGELLLQNSLITKPNELWSLWNPKTEKITDVPFDVPTAAETNYSVISPNGKTLVAGDSQGRLRWFDLGSRKQTAQYSTQMSQEAYRQKFGKIYGGTGGYAPGARGIDYAPNGQWIASRNESEITVFNSDAKKIGSLAIDGTGLFFTLAPDGEWLAAVGSLPYSPQGTLLWNVRTNDKIRLNTPSETMRDFSFSPDGKQLYGVFSVGDKLQFATWNVDEKAAQKPVLFSRTENRSFDSLAPVTKINFAVNQAEQKIAIPWLRSVEIRQFDGRTSQELKVADTSATLFSPDGELLAIRGIDGGIQLWNVSTERMVSQLSEAEPDLQTTSDENVDGKNMRSMAFSADGQLLAFARSEGVADVVELWSVQSAPRRLASLRQKEPVNALAFAPDGQSLICGGEQGNLQWIDVKSRELKSQSKIGEPIFDLAFAARNLVVMGASQSILYRVPANAADSVDPLQKAARTKLDEHFNDGRDIYTPATISPDGKLLATAQGYKDFQIWELPAGRKLQSVRNNRESSAQTSALMFSADSAQVTSIRRSLGSREVTISTYSRATAS